MSVGTDRTLRLRLAAVVLAAFALRVAGADWGAPYAYHFDEPFIVKPALRIAADGDPNPRFFRYPSLMIYLETAIVAVEHRLHGMPLETPEGAAYGPSDLATSTWPALLAGRRVVAAFGAVTVVVVGAIAAAAGGGVAGLLAASLLALFPLHVEHSHYLTTDVPAGAFLALAFLAVWLPRERRLAAALAGAALGLAVATKYTAAAALPALVALLFMRGRAATREHLTDAAILLCACGAAFFVACPFAVLDFHSFRAELDIVRQHYGTGHTGSEGIWNWGWYLRRLRDDGLGSVGLLLSGMGAAGLFYDLVRPRAGASGAASRATRLAAVMLVLSLAWFAFLGAVTVRFERNLIPAVVLACPAVGIGLGRWLDALATRGGAGLFLGWIAIALALTAPARMSLDLTRRFSLEDTRNQAGRWMQENVARGSRVVREEYTPQLDPARYRVQYTWSLALDDPRAYRRAGIDYVVASGQVYERFLNDPLRQFPEFVDRYQRFFAMPRVAVFEAGPGSSGPTIAIHRIERGGRRQRRGDPRPKR